MQGPGALLKFTEIIKRNQSNKLTLSNIIFNYIDCMQSDENIAFYVHVVNEMVAPCVQNWLPDIQS